jgi:signal peptidase I
MCSWARRWAGVAAGTVVAVILAGCGNSAPLTTYRVPTGDMLPTLKIGSLISVTPQTSGFRVGEIIVFHPSHGVDGAFITCGDPHQGFAADGLQAPQPCDESIQQPSKQIWVKRIVGLPGDTLKITDGHVIRNGVREREPYVGACGHALACTFARSITVPAGEFYVLGDNRSLAPDSRYWGPVDRSWIIGRVVKCTTATRYCTGS